MSETKPPILTVSDLNRLIRNRLEQAFKEIWVEGEVSNLRIPSSGHFYFTLKDGSSQIRTVLFKSSLRYLKFRPEDGMHLLCRGEVTVYEPRGDTQLLVKSMEPQGVGALQLAFEQLKSKLKKEGLFDADQKQPIPVLPKRIGVITSSTGAAIHDILNVLTRRFSNVEVLLNPVLVQGEEAPDSIANAIFEMNEIGGIDVLIVGRGGGSIEDLWAFNTERVARAIHASGIPVISAVGHEIDYTIADFVADLRAPTPSAAAELVVQEKDELIRQIAALLDRLMATMRFQLQGYRSELSQRVRTLMDPRKTIRNHFLRLDEMDARIRQSMENSLRRHRATFDHLLDKLKHQSPVERLTRVSVEVEHFIMRLRQAIGFIFKDQRAKLENRLGRLDSLSPVAILSRGYSLTYHFPQKQLIKDADHLKPGDQVLVRLHRGMFRGRVDKVIKESDGTWSQK